MLSEHLGHRLIYPLIQRAARNRTERVAVLSRVRRGSVRIERLLVLPSFDDRKVIGPHRMLKNIETDVALFLSACLREPSEQVAGIGPLTANVHMRDDEYAAIVRCS